MRRTCPFCRESFSRSPYRLQQKVCSKPDCQRQRKSRDHRRRYRHDSGYRDDCRRSRQQWREDHPTYHRQYRQAHPEQVRQNREKQKPRDQLRRLRQQALRQRATLELQLVSAPPSADRLETRIPLPPPLTEIAWIGLLASPAPAPLGKNNLAPP